MKYSIKKITDRNKDAWIVVNDKDQPCHKSPHKTLDEAERHREALEAFFGKPTNGS